jgi:hypothetical protein
LTSLVSDDVSTYVSITLTSTIDNESGKVGGDDDRATELVAIASYVVWVQGGEPVDETVNSFVRVRTGILLLVKARVEPLVETGR